MLLGVQLLGILFGLFMLYYSFLHYKRSELSAGEFSIWLIIWIVFLEIVIYPSSVNFIAVTFSFNRVMDMLMVIGMLFLVLLTFHNYLIVKKTENKVENLVRKLAEDAPLKK